MAVDVLVRGGHVVLPERLEPERLDVAIADGRVTDLLPPGHRTRAEREWDASGRIVIPGAVDPHVHVHWPYLGNRTVDDYETATRAAAAGGTTAIIDFALEGREDPQAAVRARRAEAEGAAVIDFSLHCVVSDADPQVLTGMEAAVADGVTSFKLYLTYRRRGLAADDETLRRVAERAAELGAVVGIHAEDADLDDEGTGRMRELGQGAARYLPEAKPPLVEVEAIRRASRIVAEAGADLWVVHLSSAAGLAAALESRAACGQPAALETCPQYLLLDRAVLERAGGHRFLCSPPLREPSDAERLWEGLAAGEIDWIGTDHLVFLAAQKDARADAFWDCPHGLPGVQTRPAMILRAGLKRGFSLNAIARLLSSGAARWFGLYPRKGTLLPGSDADLAVWDPEAGVTIDNDSLGMGGDWNPYQGLPALAPPELVLVRGQAAVSPAGDSLPAGYGRFLARAARLRPNDDV
jgi:dihydropyrimidinase